MRIRTYLLVIVLVPIFLGTMINAVLKEEYDKLSHAEEEKLKSELFRKDIVRIIFDIRQYFLSTDLLLSNGETYLAKGTIQKGDTIASSLKGLSRDEFAIKMNVGALELADSFRSFHNNTRNIVSEIYKDPNIVHSIQLDQFDQLGKNLVNHTEQTLEKTLLSINESNARVKTYRETLDKLILLSKIIFITVLILTWLWTYRNISSPIQKLSKITQNFKEKSLEGISQGPKEIQELSESFCELTNNLFFQANHDSLTGLYNRKAFNRILKDLFEKSIESNEVHTLCFIDLDHFKAINDSCGHAAGDELLKQISTTMKEAIREGDIVARLGGDEFTILFLNCEAHKARYLTEHVRKKIKDYQFYWNGKKFHISSSFGISELSSSKNDITSALNLADLACMHAKKTGRNCIIDMQEPKPHFANGNTTLSLNDIHDAIENDLFELYKQDIISSEDNSSQAGKRFELLLRLKNPEKNKPDISPSVFMPVVERFGLFPDVDRWVVRTTIDWLLNNPKELNEIELCSINLSGNSICNSEVLKFFEIELARMENLGKKLCFEITETEAINDFEYAKLLIEKIRSYGCSVALDDFGSGLSSFSYLKNLDVDYVKIDGCFVQDMQKSPSDKATVKAIVDVARAFNKKTIAEFVEDKDTADALIEMGVDFLQGYYFDTPKPFVNTIHHSSLK